MSRGRVGIVVGLLLVGGGGAIAAWLFVREPPVLFSPENWANSTPDQRDALMAALAEGGILEGKMETEVYALLGKPDNCSFGTATWRFRRGGKCSTCGGSCRPAMIVFFTREQIVRSRRLSAMGCVVSNTEFGAERWRSGSPEERGAMVRDFFATTPHEGIAKTELYRLLGQPDKETATGPFLSYTGRRYDEAGNIQKRFSGRRLSIGLRDGKVYRVTCADDS